MQAIQKVNSYLRVLERFLMAFIVGGMAILLIANVFSRVVLNDSISFAEELGSICMIASVYFGCPYCVRKCKHVRMSALMDLIPPRYSKYYAVFIDLITAAVYLFLAYNVGRYCISAYGLGSTTVALRVPRWICILPVVVGCLFTGLQYLLLVVMNLTDRKHYWIGTERQFGEPDSD